MISQATLDDPLATIEQATSLANRLREDAEQIPQSELMADVLDAADIIEELVSLAGQAWAAALALTCHRPTKEQAVGPQAEVKP